MFYAFILSEYNHSWPHIDEGHQPDPTALVRKEFWGGGTHWKLVGT